MNVHEWAARYQNDNEIRSRLLNGAKFIAIFENLKSFLSAHIRNFYTSNSSDIIINDGKVTYRESEFYKEEVKVLDKKFPFKSHVLWLLKSEAISEEQKNFLFEAYDLRNEMAHNFLEVIFDPESKFDSNHLNRLAELDDYIGRWWILNIEISMMDDPPEDISIDDVEYGASMFIRRILGIS